MIDFSKTLQAHRMGSVTLVGYLHTEFPRKHGNCFSVYTDEGSYQIVNFNYENLNELLRTEVVSFPITITPLGDTKSAMISDERIPNEWYSSYFCPVCTPTEYLLPTQRLLQILDIKRGKRIEKEYTNYDGTKGIMVQMNF